MKWLPPPPQERRAVDRRCLPSPNDPSPEGRISGFGKTSLGPGLPPSPATKCGVRRTRRRGGSLLAARQRSRSKLAGFTMIELSIVLTIIGLIIGGVMVGRDLIHAAMIRKTITQKERFEAAASTFMAEYNYLPGDLPNAANFGFSGGSGQGTGIIFTGSNCQNKDEDLFFLQSQAGLISEKAAFVNPYDCWNGGTDMFAGGRHPDLSHLQHGRLNDAGTVFPNRRLASGGSESDAKLVGGFLHCRRRDAAVKAWLGLDERRSWMPSPTPP